MLLCESTKTESSDSWVQGLWPHREQNVDSDAISFDSLRIWLIVGATHFLYTISHSSYTMTSSTLRQKELDLATRYLLFKVDWSLYTPREEMWGSEEFPVL